jgi:hypothetical protein
MWEQIMIAVVIELIRHRLDREDKEAITKIERGPSKEVASRVLADPKLSPKIIKGIADIIESIGKKLD